MVSEVREASAVHCARSQQVGWFHGASNCQSVQTISGSPPHTWECRKAGPTTENRPPTTDSGLGITCFSVVGGLSSVVVYRHALHGGGWGPVASPVFKTAWA